MNSEKVVQGAKEFLLEKGFDIVYPFNIACYNDHQPQIEYHCPSPSGNGQDFGLMIGNSKLFWIPFIQYLQSQPADWLDTHQDPIDNYTSQTIHEFIQHLKETHPSAMDIISSCKIIYSCRMEPPGMISFQRCAHAIGMAYYSDSCGLSLHPEYGPWFAMRAVLIFNIPAPRSLLVSELPDPLSTSQNNELRAGFEELIKAYPKGPTEDWIEMRKRVGKFLKSEYHQYEDNMIRYHYYKDLGILREASRKEIRQVHP